MPASIVTTIDSNPGEIVTPADDFNPSVTNVTVRGPGSPRRKLADKVLDKDRRHL
jgi:hypothetical protein